MYTAALVLGASFLIWVYKSITPPPPKICGKPNGPPVTSPRMKLSDGRHLAYKEHGVPRQSAKYKVIMVHGFDSSKDLFLPLSQEFMEKLGLYIVTYDRPGYGESDPNSKRTVKSETLDLEEFADKLQLGSKFYVVGVSMGNYLSWGCLRYIPHRLAGAALVVPVINYWWPSFPRKLSIEGYKELLKRDQCKLWIAHNAPGLVYWWMTQKWFPSSTVMERNPIIFSKRDFETIKKLSQVPNPNEYKIRQQGDYESLHRDLKIGFGSWEFDPMEVKNPFPENEGSVHLWQGYGDKLVPYQLQRFIVKKLPWMKYHEVPDGGHLIIHEDVLCEAIFSDDNCAIISLITSILMLRRISSNPNPYQLRNAINQHIWRGTACAALEKGLLSKMGNISGHECPKSTDDPQITSPRIKLTDGRHLAFREAGVPRNEAEYKIIIVHGFGSNKDMSFLAPQELTEELKIYILIYDRAGYGESDPNPNRSVKSEASDIEELADQLELGPKFYVIGVSMGAYPIWGCIYYLSHRLQGVALVAAVFNYCWPSIPDSLTKDDFRKNLVKLALWLLKHMPGLLYWWMTQKLFPSSNVMERNPVFFNDRDKEVLKRTPGFELLSENKLQNKSVFDNLRNDFMVGFGKWEFDPLKLSNPFPKNDSFVHLWTGFEDQVVPIQLQRFVSSKLPWIKHHEVPQSGHLIVYESDVCSSILRALLLDEEPAASHVPNLATLISS
ncbi:hypothetical protein Nepgr_009167 [Nepenthes gracilis]|uniref:AB hydrolase-1 domain-containing protein n=1 Tax=Nepenthes gracilis TaxID=150966 RepID=A0AAD3SA96_NEPGR|nr:hypothetical protein Nepgr_009167 [Nepenthes gracilis]